jgi:DNA-binding response OmpR family regulator
VLNNLKTVLIVDDEPLVATTLAAILNLYVGEFAAVAATTVVDALAIVRGIMPDLVLLDVMMPGVERLEHAVEIRDECGCNVLLMSGAGQTSTLLEGLVQQGMGTFEIVPKPIHPRELITKLREVIAQLPQAERRTPLQFRSQSAT